MANISSETSRLHTRKHIGLQRLRELDGWQSPFNDIPPAALMDRPTCLKLELTVYAACNAGLEFLLVHQAALMGWKIDDNAFLLAHADKSFRLKSAAIARRSFRTVSALGSGRPNH